MVKLREFIQIENLNEIQEEIRDLNYKLMNAMNQTNTLRELFAEKNELMKRARDTSSMLIPEVRELNAFVGGQSLELVAKNIPSPRKKVGVRPRKPRAISRTAPKLPRAVRIPKELEMSLPEMLRPSKRKRGRPRKVKADVAERQNPLEELRRNLANLRDA